MDKKTKDWLLQRARPLKAKWVQYHIGEIGALKPHIKTKVGRNKKGQFDRKYIQIRIRAGSCPCAECNHEWMWQCEEANKIKSHECCSNTCT